LTQNTEPSHKFTVKIGGNLRTIQGYTLSEYQMARAEAFDELQGDIEFSNAAAAVGNLSPLVGPNITQSTTTHATAQQAAPVQQVTQENPWQQAPVAQPNPQQFQNATAQVSPQGGQIQHICAHGQPMKFVPPGVSKRTNAPYPGFFACAVSQRGEKCATANISV